LFTPITPLAGQGPADSLARLEFRHRKDVTYGRPVRSAFFTTVQGSGTYPFYPRIVVFPDEVVAYDSALNPTASRKLAADSSFTVSFSPSGRYIGVRGVRDGTEHFAVYDAQNLSGPQARINFDYGEDVPSPEFSISDRDGSFIAFSVAVNKIDLYDPRGQIVKRIGVFDTSDYQSERMGNGEFSADGGRCLVVALRKFYGEMRYVPPDSPPLYAVLYDRQCNELWRRPLSGNAQTSAFGVSAQGSFCCAGDEQRTKQGIAPAQFYLFNDTGALIGTYSVYEPPHPYAPVCRFSPDEKCLVLANGNTVKLIAIESGKVIWTRTFPWEFDNRSKRFGYIGSVAVANDASIVAIVTHMIDDTDGKKPSRRLDILDRDGNSLLHNYVVEARGPSYSSEGQTMVFVSPDGGQVFLRLANGFALFERGK
jgi:hypothetical protein